MHNITETGSVKKFCLKTFSDTLATRERRQSFPSQSFQENAKTNIKHRIVYFARSVLCRVLSPVFRSKDLFATNFAFTEKYQTSQTDRWFKFGSLLKFCCRYSSQNSENVNYLKTLSFYLSSKLLYRDLC